MDGDGTQVGRRVPGGGVAARRLRAGGALVTAALAAALVAGCSDGDTAATTSSGTATAPVGTAPAATAPHGGHGTVPAATTAPPAATAPATGAAGAPGPTTPAAARRDPRLDVQLGSVNVSDLHVYRYGRELTITMNVDRSAVTVVGVFDRRGRPLAQGSVRRTGAGPVVARLALRRPQGRLRVVLSVVPPGADAQPTVISLRTQPARPRVRVLSPRPGQVVRGDRVRVRIATTAFRITDQGTRPRPRQGHFHITLDRRAYIVHYAKDKTFEGLRSGRHTLLVVPALNDHTPVPGLEPIVVRFRVVSGLRIDAKAVSRRTYRLLPRPGVAVPGAAALAWGRIPGARRYRVEVRDAQTGRRVHAATTRARSTRVPAGRLAEGRVHVWSVRGITPRGGVLVGRSWFRAS